jgi:hypothetical protein
LHCLAEHEHQIELELSDRDTADLSCCHAGAIANGTCRAGLGRSGVKNHPDFPNEENFLARDA